jgi:hypothetical protein
MKGKKIIWWRWIKGCREKYLNQRGLNGEKRVQSVKAEGKRPLGRPKHRWVYVKMFLGEIR